VLHISDLHMRSADGPQADRAKGEAAFRWRVLGEKWKTNLAELRKDAGDFDLVVFTGDLGDWGHKTDYPHGVTFLKETCAALGVPLDRLFLVPGNHDVERTVQQEAWSKLRGELQSDPRRYSGWMAGAEPKHLTGRPERELVLEREGAFWAAVASDLGRPELVPRRSAHGRLGFRQTIELPRLAAPVHIIGLDTAWLAGDEHDAGELWLTEHQVAQLTTTDRGEPLLGFRLALMHHRLADLADASTARSWLADRVDLLLHGHQHTPTADLFAGPDSQLLVLAAGCLYEGDEGHRYLNTCHVIELDLDEAARPRAAHVWFRGWSERGMFWGDDALLYQRAAGGRLHLRRDADGWAFHAPGVPAPSRVSLSAGDAAGAGPSTAGHTTRGADGPAGPRDPTWRRAAFLGGLAIALLASTGWLIARGRSSDRHPDMPADLTALSASVGSSRPPAPEPAAQLPPTIKPMETPLQTPRADDRRANRPPRPGASTRDEPSGGSPDASSGTTRSVRSSVETEPPPPRGDSLRRPRDCEGEDAISPMCSYRGTIRGMDGRPMEDVEVQLIGTDCVDVTNRLGNFDFVSCGRNQTLRLINPSVLLRVRSGPHQDLVCDAVSIQPPPLVTVVRIDIKTCRYEYVAAASVESRIATYIYTRSSHRSLLAGERTPEGFAFSIGMRIGLGGRTRQRADDAPPEAGISGGVFVMPFENDASGRRAFLTGVEVMYDRTLLETDRLSMQYEIGSLLGIGPLRHTDRAYPVMVADIVTGLAVRVPLVGDLRATVRAGVRAGLLVDPRMSTSADRRDVDRDHGTMGLDLGVALDIPIGK
jgi:predicted phosphodiesterase